MSFSLLTSACRRELLEIFPLDGLISTEALDLKHHRFQSDPRALRLSTTPPTHLWAYDKGEWVQYKQEERQERSPRFGFCVDTTDQVCVRETQQCDADFRDCMCHRRIDGYEIATNIHQFVQALTLSKLCAMELELLLDGLKPLHQYVHETQPLDYESFIPDLADLPAVPFPDPLNILHLHRLFNRWETLHPVYRALYTGYWSKMCPVNRLQSAVIRRYTAGQRWKLFLCTPTEVSSVERC